MGLGAGTLNKCRPSTCAIRDRRNWHLSEKRMDHARDGGEQSCCYRASPRHDRVDLLSRGRRMTPAEINLDDARILRLDAQRSADAPLQWLDMSAWDHKP